MTQKMTIGFILLASTYLSSPVAANMPDPTFDTLKEQAAALSENYILTESTGTLPDGAVEVTIGEKKYHFLPQENSFPLLSALSETPAGSLIETSDGIFEAEGKNMLSTLHIFPTAHIPSLKETRTTIILPYRKLTKRANSSPVIIKSTSIQTPFLPRKTSAGKMSEKTRKTTRKSYRLHCRTTG